jgi:hypothetical protein
MIRRNADFYNACFKTVLEILFLIQTTQLTKHSFTKQNILKYANY